MGKRVGPFRAFRRNEDGGVAIIGAVCIILFVALAALAIDLGSIVLKSRQVQGTADLAALAAARNINIAHLAARATTTANLSSAASVTTLTGVYQANKDLAPDSRFTAGLPNPNAARVTVRDDAPLYFAAIAGFKSVPITRTATAALPGTHPAAMFSIGSRLLGLNRGILNNLLTALLGTNVQLDLVSYQNLLGSDINLLEFMDQLAVKLDVEAGDYDALLKKDVTTKQVLEVLEVVADDEAGVVLGTLTGAPLDVPIKVSNLVGVDAKAMDGVRRALNVDVSALDLLMAGLETANGNRQLQLTGGANTGILNSQVMLAIGERPNNSAWITVSTGGVTPVISTGQTRAYITAKTGKVLDGILSVDIQLFVELASAKARVKSITCSANNTVRVEAQTGLAKVVLGRVKNPDDLNNFKVPIQTEKLKIGEIILLILPIPIEAYAVVESHDTKWQELSFNQSDIDQRKAKTVRSKEIAGSLVSNLVNKSSISVAGINLSLLTDLLGGLLTPVGNLLDLILNPILRSLGLGIGEADVSVVGIRCTGSGGIPYLVG